MVLTSLLTILALMPLYYGGIFAWSWGGGSLIIGALAVGLTVQLVLGRTTLQIPFASVKWALICFGLVMFWVIVQWSPYTPEAWHHPLWRMSAQVAGHSYEGRISVDPDATYEVGLKLLTYGVLMLVTMQVGRSAWNARVGLITLMGIIVFYSGFGVLAWCLTSAPMGQTA
jgi:hypothetical protein